MEPNGLLSYNLKGKGYSGRIIADTSFNSVDTLRCGNGYGTNGHDGLLLANGHSIMMANDPEPIDMSQIVSNGNPNAIVDGLVVQELDSDKTVLFQWRSWDYLNITASYFDLTQQKIDLIHANSLALDNDGNILVSLRHLSAIIKINRETGNVDWILGGKLNQFTFINEHESNSPTYFSYQHDINMLPNGNITLFDNGTQHLPQYSRGVEYKLDETNKTATLVWEYRQIPDIYADAMGSVQVLPNGNKVIGWGVASGKGAPVYTEVHPDNSLALELFLSPGQFCYRAYKYPWVSQTPEVVIAINQVLEGNTYSYSNSSDNTGIKIKYNQLNVSSNDCITQVTKYNYSPIKPDFEGNTPVVSDYYFNISGKNINSFNGLVFVDLNKFPNISFPEKSLIYGRTDAPEKFLPLPTSYDSAKNEISFTTSNFGDFIFGIPQNITSYAPVPISPKEKHKYELWKPENFIIFDSFRFFYSLNGQCLQPLPQQYPRFR